MMGGVLLVVLICVQAVFEVHGQNLGRCFDDFDTDIEADNSCPAFEEYYKCVFQELGLQQHVDILTEPEIMAVVTLLNSTVTHISPNCHIDYEAILKKLKEQVDPVFVHPPSQPKGYDDAATIGDCLNTFYNKHKEIVKFICPLIAPYVKCLVRITEIHKHQVETKEYQKMDKDLEVFFQGLGMNCTFDFQVASAAEVANEQPAKNAYPGLNINNPGVLVLLLPWICSRVFHY